MTLRDSLDLIGDRLRSTLGGMAMRERVLVGLTVCGLLGVAGFLAAESMSKAESRVQANLTQASEARARVDLLMKEYTALTGTVEALDARLEAGRNFAPLTWIENVGNEMGIQGNIRSVTERGVEETDYYRAQKIDLVIDDLDLRQVVDLMYRLEQAPQAVRVNEARVKANRKNRAELDLRMEIAILKPAEGA